MKDGLVSYFLIMFIIGVIYADKIFESLLANHHCNHVGEFQTSP